MVLRQHISAPALSPPPHRRGEKRTLAGLIVFIVMLVGGGFVYSNVDLSKPEPATGNGGFVIIKGEPTKIARIVTPGPGALCREISFDNETGYFSLEKTIPCDNNFAKGNSQKNGFSSFKGAFGH